MSKKQISITKFVSPLLAAGLLMAVLLLKSTPVARAHIVPTPCDFTTGGGFVISDNGNHANFGLVGGCKNGGFFGHLNFVDQDTTGFFAGWHVSSTEITAYVQPDPTSHPAFRDICGKANTNNSTFPQVFFRVRTLDGGEPGSGPSGPDKFGIELANSSGTEHLVVVTTRFLMGGNMQLHKPNPSTTGPFMTDDQITAACGGMDGSDLGWGS